MDGATARARPHLARFVQRVEDGVIEPPRLEVRPLAGGLESGGVAEVTARFRRRRGAPGVRRFVVKELSGKAAREGRIYPRLRGTPAWDIAPTLLDVEWPGEERCRLYLQHVRPARRWPWRDPELAGRVLDAAAEVHASEPAELPFWDYQGELATAGRRLMQVLEESRQPDLTAARRALPAVRRLTESLQRLRAQLFDAGPWPPGLVHGDLHPGNVLLARRRPRDRPLFLDWGRARRGSPLEDVSSWLQSLGYWEPEARRRHDTLLSRYVSFRGGPRRISRSLRDGYWLAAACNVLAGAVVYHLAVAHEASTPAGRAAAIHAAEDGLRIIRRADAAWTEGERRRMPRPGPP